ncbi:hypothetical protein AAY473_014977 [Plecturocebus cupreus]
MERSLSCCYDAIQIPINLEKYGHVTSVYQTGSLCVTQAGVQWYNHDLLQPRLPRPPQFSHLSPTPRQDLIYVVQAGLELMGSSYPPTLASKSTGIKIPKAHGEYRQAAINAPLRS